MPASAEQAWQPLAAWSGVVAREAFDALELLHAGEGRLESAALTLASDQLQGPLLERLFAIAVLGAQGGPPEAAVPVCVTSLLWWSGANAVDDVLDGDADRSRRLALGLIGGVASGAVLPQLYLARLDEVTPALLRLWIDDLATSSITAAEGEIADLFAAPAGLDRARVLRIYGRKTGAPYARDAAMATRLALSDPAATCTADRIRLEAWREVGRCFGILRQLFNDNHDRHPDRRSDLATGAPTLLLAHALANAVSGDERDVLVALVDAARADDDDAQLELGERLRRADVAASYGADIYTLHRRAARALDRAGAAGPYRDALRARIDALALWAMPCPPA